MTEEPTSSYLPASYDLAWSFIPLHSVLVASIIIGIVVYRAEGQNSSTGAHLGWAIGSAVAWPVFVVWLVTRISRRNSTQSGPR